MPEGQVEDSAMAEGHQEDQPPDAVSSSVRLPQSDVQPASAGSSGPGGQDMDVGLLAQIASEYVRFGKHVSEIFSPPRVTSLANKVGLRAGFALDLTVEDSKTGKPWNFNDPEMRARAMQMVDEEQPFVLVGCPP